MAIVVDNGHMFGVLMVEHPGGRGIQQNVIGQKCHVILPLHELCGKQPTVSLLLLIIIITGHKFVNVVFRA